MKNTLLCLMLLIFGAGFAQTNDPETGSFNPDTLLKPRKTNPVLYTDFLTGVAGGGAQGLALGLTLNYEWRKNLITARMTNLTDFHGEVVSPLFPLPFFYVEEEINEGALLFGRRYTDYNVAYTFSAGISANWNKKLETREGNNYYYNTTTMIGMPFEVSVKWFKGRRKPYHIYGLIPVGNSVAFGNSIGFKLFGNISQTTFVGLGLTIGVGFHKQY